MTAHTNSSAGFRAVTPALLWTICFFVVPFAGMVAISLVAKQQPGWSFANYTQFFTNPSYWRALTNSLEVTLLVTVISILLAYPFEIGRAHV